MKNFICKYKDKRGELYTETIEAASEAEVRSQMRASDKFVISIKQVSEFDKKLKEFTSKRVGKVDKKTISMFFSQLAFMKSSGLAIYQSIETLRKFTTNKNMQKSLEKMGKMISEGSSFSNALSEQMDTYGHSIVYQVRAGEHSGELDNTMKIIAQNLDKEIRFKSKVKSAMIYPTMIILTTIVIVYFLMTKVVPSMTSAIQGMGAELPFVTVVVIKFSDIVSKYGLYAIGLVLSAIIVFAYLYRFSKGVRFATDSLLLRIPYVGTLILKLKLTQFCRLLSSLLQSGVPMNQSLDIVKDAIGNAYVTSKVAIVKDLVSTNGMTLSNAMSEVKIFPDILIQLVTVGASSGTTPEVLDLLAGYFEEEVDESLKKVLSYVDTLLILGVGAIVGTVVISMFLPMFGVINQL